MARSPLVLPALALLALGAIQLRAQSPKPLWEVDLSRLGYEGRPPARLRVSPQDLSGFSWTYQQGVVFIDPSVLAVYFVVYDAPSDVSTPRAPSITDSFRLVAVFLNAKNGELIQRMDWTLPHNSIQVSASFLYPAAQGGFIVVLGDTVNLYSPDFKVAAHYEAHGEMSPIADPSGRSLLLRTFASHTFEYDLLATETLAVLKSWSEPAGKTPAQIDSLWGDQFTGMVPTGLYLGNGLGNGATDAKKILAARRPSFCDSMQGAGKQVMPGHICDAQDNVLTASGDFCGGWRLIGKEAMVGPICGGDDKLLTLSTSGKIISEFNLGLEGPDGPVIPSANGRRFAIPAMRWGTGKNNVPDSQSARVFELGSEIPLLTVDVPVSPDSSRGFFFADFGDTRFGWGGLALSQDGNLLAVKSGESVRIYPVPQHAAVSQCTSNCNGQAAHLVYPTPRSHPATPSPAVERMLAWFPADTETLVGATGPFELPKMSRDQHGVLSIEPSEGAARTAGAVRDSFKTYFLLLLLRLDKEFGDAPIEAAIEGSRTFRPPNGLGMATYQGSAIALFKGDITARAAAFLKDSAHDSVRSEQMEGQLVEIFQQKSEENLLTIYVAFPKPDVAVVATDESYLREVLARIGGKQGLRALPAAMPEWKHVDTSAAFWAVRHEKNSDSMYALLPPDCRAGHSTDETPMGITFSFSPGVSPAATIGFLSGDEGSLHCIQKELFSQRERGVAEMQIQYSEAQSGVVEGTYNLSEIESAQYFVFVLTALLGHPVYV